MPHSLPLTVLDAALRGALLAVLLLLTFVIARERSHAPARRVAMLLTLGLSVQVIGSIPLFEEMVPREWQAPLVAISVGNAVLFWVFVKTMFDDDFVPGPLHVIAWSGVALLAGCNCGFVAGSATPYAPILVGIQRAVPAVFAVLAAWVAIANWQGDLVESRRKLRAFVVVAGITYTLAMVIARVGSDHGRLDSVMSFVDIVALLGMLVPVAAMTIRMELSGLFAAVPAIQQADLSHAHRGDTGARGPATPAVVAGEAPPVDAADQQLTEALHRLMSVERAYRLENLTVASLAAQLSVPPYRLRRVINRQLGYRNFNAYINGYRLEEARTALADASQRHLPVLTIALEAGFQSIGPFNRAFKALVGLTPTEFRQQQISNEM